MARSFDLNFSLVSKAHRRAQAYREALDTQRVAPQLSTQMKHDLETALDSLRTAIVAVPEFMWAESPEIGDVMTRLNSLFDDEEEDAAPPSSATKTSVYVGVPHPPSTSLFDDDDDDDDDLMFLSVPHRSKARQQSVAEHTLTVDDATTWLDRIIFTLVIPLKVDAIVRAESTAGLLCTLQAVGNSVWGSPNPTNVVLWLRASLQAQNWPASRELMQFVADHELNVTPDASLLELLPERVDRGAMPLCMNAFATTVSEQLMTLIFSSEEAVCDLCNHARALNIALQSPHLQACGRQWEPSGLLAHAAQQGRVSAVASILSCEAFVNLPSETMEQAMDVAFQVATNDEVKYQIQELVRVSTRDQALRALDGIFEIPVHQRAKVLKLHLDRLEHLVSATSKVHEPFAVRQLRVQIVTQQEQIDTLKQQLASLMDAHSSSQTNLDLELSLEASKMDPVRMQADQLKTAIQEAEQQAISTADVAWYDADIAQAHALACQVTGLGLRYATFQDGQLDGPTMVTIEDYDLEHMLGITQLGLRRRLKYCMNRNAQQGNPELILYKFDEDVNELHAWLLTQGVGPEHARTLKAACVGKLIASQISMNDLAALGLPFQARKQLLLLLSQADEAGAEVAADASAVPSAPSWTTELQRQVLEHVLRENEALATRLQGQRAARSADEEVPEEFLCPITCEVMLDPVIAEDEQTYEREAILTWVRTNQTSPMTRGRISTSVMSNRSMQSMIARWRDKQPKSSA